MVIVVAGSDLVRSKYMWIFKVIMTNLVYNDVVPVKRNLPAVLQMIILQLWPHQASGWVNHLLDGFWASLQIKCLNYFKIQI